MVFSSTAKLSGFARTAVLSFSLSMRTREGFRAR